MIFFLRSIVLATGFYPVLNPLFRLYYRLALLCFAHTLRRYPWVQGAWVRRGLTDSLWVAGYSDIDLTVLMTDKTPDEDARHLIDFWRGIKVLRAFFPMLDSISIVTASEHDEWLVHGDIRRLEAPRWISIYERTLKREILPQSTG